MRYLFLDSFDKRRNHLRNYKSTVKRQSFEVFHPFVVHFSFLLFFLGKAFFQPYQKMEKKRNVTEFILIGLTQNPQMQNVVFVVFLVVYMITLSGNLLIVVALTTSQALNSPCTSS